MRAAIAARGLSLQRIADLLAEQERHLTRSTISQWQNGRCRPHATSHGTNLVLALERVLELPAGHLVVTLLETYQHRQMLHRTAPASRYVTAPRGAPVHSVAHRRARLERRVYSQRGGRGRESRQALIVVRQREHYVVGADQRPHHSRLTIDVTALRDGIESYWYMVSAQHGTRLTIHAEEGCQVGPTITDQRQYPHEPEYLTATELIFDEPLGAMETHRLSYTVSYTHEAGYVDSCRRYQRVLSSLAARELQISIGFDPQMPPAVLTRCRWDTVHGNYDNPVRTQPVSGLGDRISLENPLAGGYGWTWEWPKADLADRLSA
ncbi:MAG TPA: helix-turn-helix transcriptional regulator [Mycobacteriales bacterium]|nr:helix-turn-helix transcriptional regulator [Mycobacteriales bacterium]